MPEKIKTVSCLIPAYNEEKTVGSVVKIVKEASQAGLVKEIIVISDGSNDQTVARAKEAEADLVIDSEKNLGKGGALLEGFKRASGDIILLLDADLINLTVNDINKIVKPALNDEADMIIGYLADDEIQKFLPQISGQRALKRSIFETIADDKKFLKSRYQFEILLNRLVSKLKLITLFIPLSGLDHLKKEQKYSIGRAWLGKSRFFIDMVKAYKNHLFISNLVIAVIVVYLLFFSPFFFSRLLSGQMPPPGPGERILVVVAHPDDEIIGAGGYITDAIKNGSQIYVVVVTNGDANRFSASVINQNLILDKRDMTREGEIRIKENEKALALAGVPNNQTFYLSFPDEGLKPLLTRYWLKTEKSRFTGLSQTAYPDAYRKNINYTGRNLTDLMENIIASIRPDIIITHSPVDVHPDHSTVYTFVRLAVDQLLDRGLIAKPKIYTFLVHWQIFEYPHPLRFDPKMGLYPPDNLKNYCDWLTYPLSKQTEELKLKEIKSYKSQLSSPFLDLLLKAFDRTNELFCPVS
ncbi:MAG: PIG-L family deacetylase [Patescibacteria group bacterium]|nr:PIG-L family deacetylase [Patescibacteria group bacterium]MCL5258061.1 PIG-L family deacetylase [Patescibacteria group bacterium]